MSDDDTFRPDKKDRAKRAFDQGRGKGRYDDPRVRRNAMEVQKIERKSAEARGKMRVHMDKFKPMWAMREFQKLQRENPFKAELGRASGPRAPLGAESLKAAYLKTLATRARANVDQRCEKRLRSLEQVERRMVRKVLRTRSRAR
ncbi:MAG: hypothetical protein QNI84_12165 [Henriciella sp.]|nr:hypothetical protein [Henriciella sp.]